MLAGLQFGSVLYVLLFGLLVLAFNYYAAPAPSVVANRLGWSIVAASLLIALFKLDGRITAVVALISISAGVTLQRFGRRSAAVRVEADREERQEEAESREEEDRRIQSLVGREGITVSDLKACGTVEIDGVIVSVRALRGFVACNTQVIVREIDGNVPVVEPMSRK